MKVFWLGIRKSSRTQAKSKFENTYEDLVDILSEEKYKANNHLDEQKSSSKYNDSKKKESLDVPPYLGTDCDPYNVDVSYLSHYYSSTSTDWRDEHDEFQLEDTLP